METSFVVRVHQYAPNKLLFFSVFLALACMQYNILLDITSILPQFLTRFYKKQQIVLILCWGGCLRKRIFLRWTRISKHTLRNVFMLMFVSFILFYFKKLLIYCLKHIFSNSFITNYFFKLYYLKRIILTYIDLSERDLYPRISNL